MISEKFRIYVYRGIHQLVLHTRAGGNCSMYLLAHEICGEPCTERSSGQPHCSAFGLRLGNAGEFGRIGDVSFGFDPRVIES